MVEMVPEAESTKIFLKLARKHDIVFATSFGYMDGMEKAAKKNPRYNFHARYRLQR